MGWDILIDCAAEDKLSFGVDEDICIPQVAITLSIFVEQNQGLGYLDKYFYFHFKTMEPD